MLNGFFRSQDFLAGVFFIAFGCLTLYLSAPYSTGTAASMGPGLFPKLVGYLIIILGALTVGRDFIKRGQQEMARIHLRPLFFVTLGIFIFGWQVDRLGLVVSTIILIVLARIGGLDSQRFVEIAVLSILSATVVSIVFAYGFNIPFPIFPR
ncbi:tripartite tricarboxylate transporter TctB family protein [Aquamicrobium terrae]|uniref:Phosphate/sulfate permease n=1 Tax=Aquamicrobium terrae TaxID=1324945 RepID=A0ABV2N7C0_9HYPH